MGIIGTILFTVAVLIIWIVAGGFITQSSVKLIPFKNEDSYLKNAYAYSTAAAVTTWLLVAFGVFSIVMTFIFSAEIAAAAEVTAETASIASIERAAKGVSWVTLSALFFSMSLVLVTGVLAALTSTNIKASESFNELGQPYYDSIVSAGLSLSTFLLLVIGMIIYILVKHSQKEKAERQAAALGLRIV